MAENIYDHFTYTNTMINRENLEQEFNKPMPLIGIYIAVASSVCTIAMAADTIQSFTRRKLWFPCRFFALNAASLTVIAVAMKLPVDLNNPMYGRLDQLAKFSSTVFLCTMLANFMPSLGAMEDMELLMNIVALVIMVVTVLVNLCVQIGTKVIVPESKEIFVVTICSMVFVLAVMSCSALTVSVSKKVLESRYKEMHKVIVHSNEGFERTRMEKIEKLQEDVVKYWIMAITSSPQFVLVCSETCCACGVICVMVDVFLVLYALTMLAYDSVRDCDSVYKDSTLIISIVQCVGVVVGSIAPISRLFTALSLRLTIKWSKNYLRIYRIESYWTERLVEWKQVSPLDELPMAGRMFRKFIYNAKSYLLDLCIIFITAVVVLSKIIRLLSNFLVILFLYCYFCFRFVKRKVMNDSSGMNTEEELGSRDESVRPYALQFHDGVELSNRTLKNIKNGVDWFVQAARERKPRELMDLLKKSRDFDGVLSFDNDQVPHLFSYEPPNCWSLPVITLTSILMALPNVDKNVIENLLKSVKKGLSYVKHVEETLDWDGELAVVRNASDVVWPGVELCGKWLKNNLKDKTVKSEESVVRWLRDKAKTIVLEDRISNGDEEWSINAVAANSMYRICESIMLDYQASEDEELLERLSKMIADILSACFANLPRVVSLKCYSSAIEKREESVRIAANLLGETEEILKVLSQRELPNLDLHHLVYIDEWRRSIKLQT